jgi:hypothetical protein
LDSTPFPSDLLESLRNLAVLVTENSVCPGNGLQFLEESGRASSGLALASAADQRARFLRPVMTLFYAILSLFGRVDLGTLRLGLLILGVCSE